MNPDVRQKWLTALRSGEYKQATGELRSGDNFCCLGVLCDLHGKEHGKSWETESYYGEVCVLPEVVMTWAGLPDTAGAEVVIDDEKRDLTEHNDEGATFEMIADAIESQL